MPQPRSTRRPAVHRAVARAGRLHVDLTRRGAYSMPFGGGRADRRRQEASSSSSGHPAPAAPRTGRHPPDRPAAPPPLSRSALGGAGGARRSAASAGGRLPLLALRPGGGSACRCSLCALSRRSCTSAVAAIDVVGGGSADKPRLSVDGEVAASVSEPVRRGIRKAWRRAAERSTTFLTSEPRHHTSTTRLPPAAAPRLNHAPPPGLQSLKAKDGLGLQKG